MNIKKIVFYVMCALLAIMIIVAGITIGKAGALVGSILNPAPPATDSTVSTTEGTEASTDATDPPETNAPTSGTVDSNHKHSYEEFQSSPATCTEDGYTLYKCGCGDVETRDVVDALGHSYGVGKVITSCTEECYTKYECSRCGHVDKRDVTMGAGHKFDIEEEIPADCENDACIIRKCSNPNCTETETEFITGTSLGGHNYSILVEEVKATCTSDGHKVYRCSNNGCTAKPKIDDIVQAEGHKFIEWFESGSGMKTVCEKANCNVAVHSSELEITNAYQSATDLHRIYSYTIIDNRSEADKEANKLSYSLDPKHGLLVEYLDALGSEQKTALGFKDNSLTIE